MAYAVKQSACQAKKKIHLAQKFFFTNCESFPCIGRWKCYFTYMKKPVSSFLTEIKSLAKSGARFASLVYTAKGSGEIARHTVCLGVNIGNAYRRDIAILSAKRDSLAGVALVACDELLASLRESLAVGIGKNSAYTCAGVYETLAAGVKLHIENSELHVYGFTIGKEVIAKGEHKTVKSSEKTLAKNALRRAMKSGKFRQFAISELEAVAMNGKKLVFA
jgi:hypothetical protein